MAIYWKHLNLGYFEGSFIARKRVTVIYCVKLYNNKNSNDDDNNWFLIIYLIYHLFSWLFWKIIKKGWS